MKHLIEKGYWKPEETIDPKGYLIATMEDGELFGVSLYQLRILDTPSEWENRIWADHLDWEGKNPDLAKSYWIEVLKMLREPEPKDREQAWEKLEAHAYRSADVEDFQRRCRDDTVK